MLKINTYFFKTSIKYIFFCLQVTLCAKLQPLFFKKCYIFSLFKNKNVKDGISVITIFNGLGKPHSK